MSAVVDWRLRLRTLLSLCVIVLVNTVLLAVAFLTLAAVSAGIAVLAAMVLIATVGDLPGIDVALGAFVLLLPVVAIGGGVFALWWQVRHGATAVVDGLDAEPIDGEGPRNLGGRVRRLAAQADVQVPDLAVVEASEPTCLTVRVDGTPTVLVTTALLDRLGDDELDAVLAHEIVHIANRDVFLATVLASLVTTADRLLEREQAYRKLLGLLVALSLYAVTILIFGLPLLVVALLYVVVSVLARVLLAGNAIALGLFAQAREYVADSGACELTGNPAALASALTTLDGTGPPQQDGRLRATAALGVVPEAIELRDDEEFDHPVSNWLESIGVEEGWQFEQGDDPGRVERWLTAGVYVPVRDAIGRLRSWRPATHPPTDKRIERIRDRS